LKRWQLWVGLVVSLFFLYWAFQQVNSLGNVLNAMGRANYVMIFPALMLYFLGVWLRAARWGFLLAPVKRIPLDRLFPVVVIGYMANDVLPARMGEFVRAYILGEKELVSKSASLATIVIERVLDGVVLLFFAVVISFFVPFGQGLQNIVRLTSIIFAVAIAIFFLMGYSARLTTLVSGVLARAAPRALRPRFEKVALSFVGGLQAMQRGKLLASTIVLSAAAWICEAGMYYLIALGFDLRQPFYVLVLTAVVANLGTMIPSSPGYVGTFEALCLFVLALFGANPDLAMSYTIVLHVALLVPVTVLGFFYLWRSQLSLGAMAQTRISDARRRS